MALKEQAPWRWMLEDQIFGVRNPETGQIGYVSVMGALGEHLAVAVYLGSEGLEGFWRMHEGTDVAEYALLEVPQLQAAFMNREDLLPEDREILKGLGVKVRGRQAWPAFHSIVPGCLPWPVDPAEASYLALALEQTIEVAKRVASDPRVLKRGPKGTYLVRTLAVQGWIDEWLSPPATPPPPLPSFNREQAAALRARLPRTRMTVQIDLFPLGVSIRERRGVRPYLAYTLLVVDAESGLVLGSDVMTAQPSLQEMWSTVPTKVMGIFAGSQMLPARIATASSRLEEYLAPLAAEWNCPIKTFRRLPALEAARTALEQFMAR